MFEIKNLKFKGKRKKFIVLLEELCFLIIVDFVARQNKGSFFYSLPFSLLCGLVSGLPFADLARSQRPFSPVTGGGGGGAHASSKRFKTFSFCDAFSGSVLTTKV